LAWLEALNAPDLGIFLNGKDYSATQEMSEEFRQEISYQGAFGTDGPVLRNIRMADEGSVTFSAILLKRGAARGLNDEDLLRSMRDFEIQVRRGPVTKTYVGCNWTRISIRSTMDQVTLDADISVPGYVRDTES
jgi:hypothetical protein